jgi:Predicted transcriptional regulator
MRTPHAPEFLPDRLREASGELTQQDIAVRLGISLSTVQKWFAGKTVPGGAKLIALARLLDRDPSWFFSERDRAAV